MTEEKKEAQEQKRIEFLQGKLQQLVEKGNIRKIASECTLATHVGKITDSSADKNTGWRETPGTDTGSPYVSLASTRTDFLDAIYPSAAQMTPASILCTRLQDGRSFYEHLAKDDAIARKICAFLGDSYASVREELLAIQDHPEPQSTDGRLRQVYFPIDGKSYHLLTILPSSSLLAELNQRQRNLREHGREKKKAGETYATLPPTVHIKFGGSKPQNVSCLANQEKDFHLLSVSIPAVRKRTSMDPPKKEFFQHASYLPQMRRRFRELLPFYQKEILRYAEKNHRREVLEHIADSVIQEACRLQALPAGWTQEASNYLPDDERHWLDAGTSGVLTEEEQPQLARKAAHWMADMLRAAHLHQKKKPSPTLFLEDAELSRWEKMWKNIFRRLAGKGDAA